MAAKVERRYWLNRRRLRCGTKWTSSQRIHFCKEEEETPGASLAQDPRILPSISISLPISYLSPGEQTNHKASAAKPTKPSTPSYPTIGIFVGAAPVPADEEEAVPAAAAAVPAVPVADALCDAAVELFDPLPPVPPVSHAFAGAVTAVYVCELAASAELQISFEAFCTSSSNYISPRNFKKSSLCVSLTD